MNITTMLDLPGCCAGACVVDITVTATKVANELRQTRRDMYIVAYIVPSPAAKPGLYVHVTADGNSSPKAFAFFRGVWGRAVGGE